MHAFVHCGLYLNATFNFIFTDILQWNNVANIEPFAGFLDDRKFMYAISNSLPR